MYVSLPQGHQLPNTHRPHLFLLIVSKTQRFGVCARPIARLWPTFRNYSVILHNYAGGVTWILSWFVWDVVMRFPPLSDVLFRFSLEFFFWAGFTFLFHGPEADYVTAAAIKWWQAQSVRLSFIPHTVLFCIVVSLQIPNVSVRSCYLWASHCGAYLIKRQESKHNLLVGLMSWWADKAPLTHICHISPTLEKTSWENVKWCWDFGVFNRQLN